MPQANNGLQKGPYFKEDDCTLPVYLPYYVVYGLNYRSDHRIIDDRMENSVNGRRIRYNLR